MAYLPRIDERLAPPETRLEYLNGQELFAAPADPPHATRHADVVMVLRAAVAPGYTAALDLLTRTADANDFASDASIYPSDPDKEGHRQLEELAFEVTSQQAINVPTQKARELIRCGVRRVFCVLVDQPVVLEWSRAIDGWQPMLLDGAIEDRCLVIPIKVRALLEESAADDAVATAFLKKQNLFISDAFREAYDEAALRTARAALLTIVKARSIVLDDAARMRIERERDPAVLARWIERAATAKSSADVFS